MPDGKAIASAYRRAGIDFLAYKLEPMFRKLETPEEVALHNALYGEIILMVGKSKAEVNLFYRVLANTILAKWAKKKKEKKTIKSFAKMVAESILSVAKG